MLECPKCRITFDEGKRFCRVCGSALNKAAAPAPSLTERPRHKKVVVTAGPISATKNRAYTIGERVGHFALLAVILAAEFAGALAAGFMIGGLLDGMGIERTGVVMLMLLILWGATIFWFKDKYYPAAVSETDGSDIRPK